MAGESNNVEITVRSQLMKIAADLEAINKAQADVGRSLKDVSESVGKTTEEATKRVMTGMDKLKKFGRSLADTLRKDFQSLVSLNSVFAGLKLSEQFAGSMKQSVELSDTIRKLGRTFGIAETNFASFQSKLTKGLGQIGLSSDVAARSLEGLADTPVRGQENLLGYAKVAGQLASISGQQGQEGGIAKGIANVIMARGGNPNDMGQVNSVAEDLRRARNATGKGPTEMLRSMQDLFTNMSSDFRKTFSTRGLVNLAAAGQVAGPNSTKFLEEFLSKSPIARKAMEAQGMKGVFTNNGLNVEQFRKSSKEILGRIGMDPRMAAQTLGLSEEAAEGFIRLAQSLDKVKAAQDGIANSTGDLNEQYRSSMGLGESFRANINRVKGIVSAPLGYATQGVTNLLSKTAGSDMGSALAVGGGGLLAAVLAGRGLKGVGKGLGIGGIASAAATEAITGREVQPVYVTNASEIGGGLAGAAGGVTGFLGKAGGVAAAGAIGYGVGTAANGLIDAHTQGTTQEGFSGNAIERLIFKMDKLFGGEAAGRIMRSQHKLEVELKSESFKKSSPPGRGASQ